MFLFNKHLPHVLYIRLNRNIPLKVKPNFVYYKKSGCEEIHEKKDF